MMVARTSRRYQQEVRGRLPVPWPIDRQSIVDEGAQRHGDEHLIEETASGRRRLPAASAAATSAPTGPISRIYASTCMTSSAGGLAGCRRIGATSDIFNIRPFSGVPAFTFVLMTLPTTLGVLYLIHASAHVTPTPSPRAGGQGSLPDLSASPASRGQVRAPDSS